MIPNPILGHTREKPATQPPITEREPSVFDALRNRVFTLVTLRRIFLLLTRSHFSDNAHYGGFKDQLKEYVWSKDPKSKLFIDLDYHYLAKNLDHRPAIFVGCDDLVYSRVVIDNFKANNADRSGKEYVTVGSTNIIIRHISSTADDAMTLCELSAQFFLGIRPLMQEQAKFRTYDVVKQGTSKPFERAGTDADMKFVADLIIHLEFNALWLSVQESHRIKTITFKQAQSQFVNTGEG